MSDCILWPGPLDRFGYGKRNSELAHRVAYEKAKGLIPAGMHLDHLCHTNDLDCPGGIACLHRRCVNPDHLEVVTPSENSRRGNARRQACCRGHAYTPENTRLTTNARGYVVRVCRSCVRENSARHARKRAAVRSAVTS